MLVRRRRRRRLTKRWARRSHNLALADHILWPLMKWAERNRSLVALGRNHFAAARGSLLAVLPACRTVERRQNHNLAAAAGRSLRQLMRKWVEQSHTLALLRHNLPADRQSDQMTEWKNHSLAVAGCNHPVGLWTDWKVQHHRSSTTVAGSLERKMLLVSQSCHGCYRNHHCSTSSPRACRA